MTHSSVGAPLWMTLVFALATSTSALQGQSPRLDTPQDLLDAWVDLWSSYDLDRVSDLFLQDERLTYFSSEKEGLLKGFEQIVEHHRGFGFEPEGSPRDQVIWVEDVQINEFGDAALIAAIWYFGNPDSPADAQRGPMSAMSIRTADGQRFVHMHFSTYGS
jgi:ketosteroid isomerase-like protein